MLTLSSGNSGSYIRFMAQKMVWENKDKETITLDTIVMDMDSVRTGWLLLAVGQRDWVEDAAVGVKGKQPSPDYKYGFSVKLFSKPLGVVEWSANQVGSNRGFQAIFNLCDKAADANPGKVPVIKYEGATSLKIGAGNTSVPNFTLKNWINRPAALDADPADADFEEQVMEQPQPVKHYHKGPVQSAKPKPPAPVQVQVQDDEEMFN